MKNLNFPMMHTKTYIAMFLALFIPVFTPVKASQSPIRASSQLFVDTKEALCLPNNEKGNYPNIFDYTEKHNNTPINNTLPKKEEKRVLINMVDELHTLALRMKDDCILLGVALGNKKYLFSSFSTNGLLDKNVHYIAHQFGYHIVQTNQGHPIPSLLQWMRVNNFGPPKFVLTNTPVCTHCHNLLKIIFNHVYALQVDAKNGCNGKLFPWPMPLAAQDFLGKTIQKADDPFKLIDPFVIQLMGGVSQSQLDQLTQLLTQRYKVLENKNTQIQNQHVTLQDTLSHTSSELNLARENYSKLENKNTQIQNQLSTLQDTLKHKNHELNLSKENYSRLQDEFQKLSCKLNDAEQKTIKQAVELQDFVSQIVVLKKQLAKDEEKGNDDNTPSHTNIKTRFKEAWDTYDYPVLKEIIENNQEYLREAVTGKSWLKEYLFANNKAYTFKEFQQDQSALHIEINAKNITPPIRIILDAHKPNKITINPDGGDTLLHIVRAGAQFDPDENITKISQLIQTIVQITYTYQKHLSKNDLFTSQIKLCYDLEQIQSIRPVTSEMSTTYANKQSAMIYDYIRTHIKRDTKKKLFHLLTDEQVLDRCNNIYKNAEDSLAIRSPLKSSTSCISRDSYLFFKHVFFIMDSLELLGMKQFPNY